MSCVITNKNDVVVSVSLIPGVQEIPPNLNVYFPVTGDLPKKGDVYVPKPEDLPYSLKDKHIPEQEPEITPQVKLAMILDRFLPPDGVETEREKLRLNLFREIFKLIEEVKNSN